MIDWTVMKVEYNFIDKCGRCNADWVVRIEKNSNKQPIDHVIRRDGLYNFLTPDGKILCHDWYWYVHDFFENFGAVQRHDKLWNFVDTKGKILHPEEWFKFKRNFHGGLAQVQKQDGTWYDMDTKGKLHERNK